MEQVRPEAAPRAPGPAPGPAADENPVVLRKAEEMWCMQSHRLHALCTWPSRCYVAPHVRDRRLRWLRAGSLSGWESADVRRSNKGALRSERRGSATVAPSRSRVLPLTYHGPALTGDIASLLNTQRQHAPRRRFLQGAAQTVPSQHVIVARGRAAAASTAHEFGQPEK